jgi:hypothetical protein
MALEHPAVIAEVGIPDLNPSRLSGRHRTSLATGDRRFFRPSAGKLHKT